MTSKILSLANNTQDSLLIISLQYIFCIFFQRKCRVIVTRCIFNLATKALAHHIHDITEHK